jgi:hypothetical protein
MTIGKVVEPFEQQNSDQGCPDLNAQGVFAGSDERLYFEVLLKSFYRLSQRRESSESGADGVISNFVLT